MFIISVNGFFQPVFNLFFKGNLWVYGQDEKEATQNANRILKPLESANISVVRVSFWEKRDVLISYRPGQPILDSHVVT